MSYFYLLMGPDAHLDLARAELWALAGCEAQGRVAEGTRGIDVSRAAYVRFCAQQLAASADWSELRREIRRLRLHCEGFRISVYRPAPKVKASASQIEKSVADCLSGHPHLDAPRVEFVVVPTPGCWHFGRILSRTQQHWQRHVQVPHHYSNSLPPQMARALVNLVAAPGDILIDACCGTGGVVAEALHDGIKAWGVEINPGLARHAAANLRAMHLPANIIVGDARTVTGTFDAAVVDMPYGHSSRVAPDLYTEILLNLHCQVHRMVVVFGQPQHELLAQLRLRILREARVPKGRLVRHVYLVAGEKEE